MIRSPAKCDSRVASLRLAGPAKTPVPTWSTRLHPVVIWPAAALGGTQVMIWYGSAMSQVLQWTQFDGFRLMRLPLGWVASSTIS